MVRMNLTLSAPQCTISKWKLLYVREDQEEHRLKTKLTSYDFYNTTAHHTTQRTLSWDTFIRQGYDARSIRHTHKMERQNKD